MHNIPDNVAEQPPAPAPLFSVMVPVYNPDGEYLRQALQSVCAEGIGPDMMQICVVDDHSSTGDVAALVHRIAGTRVEYVRQAANMGVAANWNDCIARAQGAWVHLLHQDDFVFPGFYRQFGQSLSALDDHVALAMTRSVEVDAESHWHTIAPLLRSTPGIADDFLLRLGRQNFVRCPAVLVRRAAYAAVGPYRSDLRYILDWEMWTRLGVKYKVWFHPAILAGFRIHPGSETARLARSGDTFTDTVRGLRHIQRLLPTDIRAKTARDVQLTIAYEAHNSALALRQDGHRFASVMMAFNALRYGRRFAHLRLLAACLVGALGLSRARGGNR